MPEVRRRGLLSKVAAGFDQTRVDASKGGGLTVEQARIAASLRGRSSRPQRATTFGTYGSDAEFAGLDGAGSSAPFTVPSAHQVYAVSAVVDLSIGEGIEAWGVLNTSNDGARGYTKGRALTIGYGDTGMTLGPIPVAAGDSVFVQVFLSTNDDFGGFVRFSTFPLS